MTQKLKKMDHYMANSMTLLVTGQSLNRNVSKSIETLYNLLVPFESGSVVYQMRFHQGFFTNSPTDSELFQDPISLVTGQVMEFVIYVLTIVVNECCIAEN